MTAGQLGANDLVADAAVPKPPKRNREERALDGGWKVAFWFLLPSLLGFLIFYLIPTIRAIRISFTEDSLTSRNPAEWIGAENYRELWSDDRFWDSVWVTLKFVAMNIGSQTILALILAVMMDRLTRSLIVRGILLVPWVLPNVLVAMLWLFLLDPRVGFVNSVIESLGFSASSFLNDSTLVVPAMAFINTWKFTGYTALLLFAGMQTIPRNLYEAGALDGSSEMTMFRTITLPLLKPVLALVMVVSLIGSFQMFDVAQTASGGLGGETGGPSGASRVIYIYIYENAFLFRNKFGYAAAMATVLMGFLMFVTLAQLRLLRANESDLA